MNYGAELDMQLHDFEEWSELDRREVLDAEHEEWVWERCADRGGEKGQ